MRVHGAFVAGSVWLAVSLVVPFVLLPSPAPAADIRVRTFPESLTVGDRVSVEVQVDAPPGAQVVFPQPPPSRWAEVLDLKTLAPATVGDESGASGSDSPGASDDASTGRTSGTATPGGASGAASSSAGKATWTGLYTLALFGVGNVVLPPWTVQIQADASTTNVQTDSLRFYVASVLDDSVAAADIRDLKPQQEIRVPLPLWVWVVAAALLVAALLIWWMRRRRSRRAIVTPVAPLVPAHQWALAELNKLESRKLPLDGKIKEHYVRLSEILRSYLERSPHFAFTALEETTEEILRELHQRRYKAQVREELGALCEEADLVKFAKHEPTVEECNGALERVRHFVMETAKTGAAELREIEPSLAAVAP